MSASSRRTFLAASAAVAAGGVTAAPATRPAPMLVHHVFFWLKNPESRTDLSKLLAGLRTLEQIESVRSIHIGVPASTEKRSVVDSTYSASELLFFDDVAGQNVYQEHPVHKQFVADCSHLWDRVLVYDAVSA
jgi:hypothetical protein